MRSRAKGKFSIPSQKIDQKERANASPAWHFFEKDVSTLGRFAYCKLCADKRQKQIKDNPNITKAKLEGVFSRGTATNSSDWGTKALLQHLKTVHKEPFEKYKVEKKEKHEKETISKYLYGKVAGEKASPISIVSSKIHKKKQPTLHQTINGQHKWPKDDPMTIAVTQSVVEYITYAALPVNHIDSVPFRKLMAKIKPKYPMPSATIFSRKVIPSLHINLKETVREVVNRSSFISFTSDLWTSKYSQDCFIAFTGHMVALDNTSVETLLLGCKYFPKAHTSPNITAAIEDLIAEYEIPRHKIGAIITDNAPNVIKGAKDTGLNAFGCILHRINLAVIKGIGEMKGIKSIVEKCRSIVSYVHKSSSAKEGLSLHQEKLELKTRRLKTECVTR